MNLKTTTNLLFFCLSLGFFAHAANFEGVVVITQDSGSDVEEHFIEKVLPQIEKYLKTNGIRLRELEAKDGLPPEIHMTPSIVYQNGLGRSIYQGRTHTIERIKHFINTSRFRAQGNNTLQRNNIAVTRRGRMLIGAPVKISEVTGSTPSRYRSENFQREARESIRRGWRQLKVQSKASFARSDRLFYMDFYPWHDKGMLYLSVSLFSPFHCKKPIFSRSGDKGFVGPWKQRDRLFREAAAIMEQEILIASQDFTTGDGFDPVSKKIPHISWKNLGLALPPKRAGMSAKLGSFDATQKNWKLIVDKNKPVVQFHFPAPLDSYAGVIKRATGYLALKDPKTLNGATASVLVDCRSTTMGESDLDDALNDPELLHISKFPQASFEFKINTETKQRLEFGRLDFVELEGTFSMKGKKKQAKLRAQMEPAISKQGKLLMTLAGQFKIDLRDYDITPAEGPSPQRHTVVVDYDFDFQAKP